MGPGVDDLNPVTYRRAFHLLDVLDVFNKHLELQSGGIVHPCSLRRPDFVEDKAG